MTLARRISTQRIFEGRIFSVDLDQVEEPGAVLAQREVTRHRGSVGIVAITGDDKILLVRQYRYPVDAMVWEIPAGRLDAAEAPDRAARRELEEETGFTPAQIEPLSTYWTSPGFCDETMHLFRATQLSPLPARPDPDERIEVSAFAYGEMRALIARGEVREAKTLIALLLEGERRGSRP
jgi:ADP-ribose pyrophosphatase